MLSDTISLLFNGFIVGTVFSTVAGIVVGYAADSRGWRIGLLLFFAVFATLAVASTKTMQTLGSRQAHIMMGSGYNADTILIGVVGGLIAVFMIGSWIGRGAKSGVIESKAETIRQISEPDLLEIIENVVALPQIALMPWVASGWLSKSDDERRAWVRQHKASLREFIVSYGGLESTPPDYFVVELQRLDRLPRRGR